MFGIKNLRYKLFVSAAILAYAVVMRLVPGAKCIILAVTGYPCPGCGMTRALACALTFNFQKAFSFHFMFWSLPVLYLCFLYDGKLFPKKWQNTIFYALIITGFAANWLYRLGF